MEIKQITNQAEWDNWLKDGSNFSFTQSFGWGEILKNEGKEVERIAVLSGNQILGAAQMVRNKASKFEYYFCPKGPVFKEQPGEILKKDRRLS